MLLTVRVGNYLTPDDVLLAPPEELARRCRISPLEAKRIVEILFQDDLCGIQTLQELAHESEEKITTGDEHLDHALGGGIRTGMLWEVVGERSVFASCFVQYTILTFPQCGWKNAAGFAVVAAGADTTEAWRAPWLDLLSNNVLGASNGAPAQHTGRPPVTVPFIVWTSRRSHHVLPYDTRVNSRPIRNTPPIRRFKARRPCNQTR